MRFQYAVNRVEFLGKWVTYFTCVGDECFISIHNRTGLSDDRAKQYFRKEHDKEVNTLRQQKLQRASNELRN